MPTFPSPPLKFRKAGFPRYGFKAGISDGAFPSDYELIASCGLQPSFVPLAASVVSSLGVERRGAPKHHHASGLCRFAPGALAPMRVILSLIIIT